MAVAGSLLALVVALTPFIVARAIIGTGRWMLIAGFLATMTLSLFFLLDSQQNYVLEVVRACLLIMVFPVAIVVLLPAGWLADQRWIAKLSWLDSPLVAPIVTPIVLGIYFFTGVWLLTLTHSGLYALSYPVLLIVGLVMHVGLVGVQRQYSANMFAVLFFLGLVELLLDSIPGIVMMLNAEVINASYWMTVSAPGTTNDDLLQAQHVAGGLMLVIADFMDLPVLAVIVARWMRADAREAREMDALLYPQGFPAVDESTQTPAATIDPREIR